MADNENATPEITTDNSSKNSLIKQSVEACKMQRRKLIRNWTTSIDYRRGKPFASQSDENRVSVNLDWIFTKSKQATLFSQVPKVRLDHDSDLTPQAAPWAIPFEKKLNDTLVEAGIESAMDECLPDCINAAGIGAILVSYETLTEDRQVPTIDTSQLPPEILSQVLQTGQLNGEAIPMETVPATVAKRYTTQRISPADLIWDVNFTGSDFDKADLIGRSGRLPWAVAKTRFKLTDADKESVLGDSRNSMDRLTHDIDRDRNYGSQIVDFDEVFYKEYAFDPEAKSFDAIHHLVFVKGKTEPVVDETWKGQQVGEDGSIIGARRFPIRVLTLSYITDETIPPSDSAIARPQVDELNISRTQMVQQRQRSLPIRTVDINRLDPSVLQSMMRGTWQQFIPVQGDGSRIVNEVARSGMPQENFLFDKVAKSDAQELWGMNNQTNLEAHGDDNQNKSNFNTQPGRERAKVASFFVSIADVLAGLMCLYEEPSSLGQGFTPEISKTLRYSILADSTVLLDAGQKLSRLNQFVNLYAKSGWVNLEPVLQEIATLTGLDANAVVKAPSPKPPVEPNISLRLTGVEDMLNPLALAFLIKSGQAPPPDLIEQAKQLIQQAVVPPQQPGVPPQGMPPGAPQGASLQPPAPAPPAGTPLPPPPPPKVGEAHPAMSGMPQVVKRTESGGKQ